MKIGDSVKQVVHLIAGVISRKQYDENSDGFIYQVDYTDENGQPSHRWFAENEIVVDASYVAPVPLVEVPVTLTVIDGGV